MEFLVWHVIGSLVTLAVVFALASMVAGMLVNRPSEGHLEPGLSRGAVSSLFLISMVVEPIVASSSFFPLSEQDVINLFLVNGVTVVAVWLVVLSRWCGMKEKNDAC